jgi:hypothetical protein
MIVSIADNRCSTKIFILLTEALKESFSASNVQKQLLNLLYIVLLPYSNCLLQPFLAVLQFQFFDLKPNSLQSCCLRVIVFLFRVINLVLNLFIYFGFMDFMFSQNQKTSHFIGTYNNSWLIVICSILNTRLRLFGNYWVVVWALNRLE